jgi:hypothetical protein
MQQMQHYGQALVQGPTDFDDEVERELAKHYPRKLVFGKCTRFRLVVAAESLARPSLRLSKPNRLKLWNNRLQPLAKRQPLRLNSKR